MAGQSRVLVVDDEPEIIRYLEQVLRRLGYQTVSAANGAQAIEQALAAPPDLVLLDVMMPVLDGFAVCRALREHEATRLVPVVVMTALQGVDNRVKLLEHGADDVLAKPVDERELIARVQGALARKQHLDRRIAELSRVRDHFAKFVPDAVRRLVLANPEAPELAKQELDVSVLFVDISGYSRLAERVAPADLNALVERYFGSFLDRITDAGGDINETSGDGFMAIFQDGDPT
ncbi:MAG TPA: response regulator, partial [Candidatus Bathyarchaeia archaeon]|nr:response regulator [Candidatus Bathyarchaeia archaeon]